MAKRGGRSLHDFIMREAASTGQRKDKLTKAQQVLLDMAASPTFRDGLSLYGAREFRTAKSLDRRGLAHITAEDRLHLTDAGRAAPTADDTTSDALPSRLGEG